jgi:hypothetical protein
LYCPGYWQVALNTFSTRRPVTNKKIIFFI